MVSIRSLGRVCQDAETREVLARVEKQVVLLDLYFCSSVFLIVLYFSMYFYMFKFLQVAVLSQSTGRVASSSEQYGAVQQEARVATAIEVMQLRDIWIFSQFVDFLPFLASQDAREVMRVTESLTD